MNIFLRKGFTLVELLVVISIIGVLATVVYASFEPARQEARNKAFMSELKETQLALEVYRAQNDRYPEVLAACGSGTNPVVANSRCGDQRRQYIFGHPTDTTQRFSNFIKDLPRHVKSNNSACTVQYAVSSDGSWYKLTAIQCIEGATSAATGIGQDNEFARCPTSCGSCAGSVTVSSAQFYESLAVYSSGGECQ